MAISLTMQNMCGLGIMFQQAALHTLRVVQGEGDGRRARRGRCPTTLNDLKAQTVA